MTERLTQARRVIVKIGSALLVDEDTGEIRRHWLEALCTDLARLHGEGKEVVVVSSGSIALGRRHLGIGHRLKLEESQAAAAVGQIRLAHAYQEILARFGITGAQILLTIGDTEERRRYLNARSTVNTLLGFGAVPVINENDTVATSEIRFGDNDRLAARVALMIGADSLIILSDVDGLYTADPESDPTAELVPEVARVTPEIEAMAGAPRPMGVGSGGMTTKIAAAKIATAAGCHMAIINGRVSHPLTRFLETGRGSWFRAEENSVTARKLWISGALQPMGTITIDDGAARALRSGRSLLHAGVVAIDGQFGRGDPVIVADKVGAEIARGLSAYDSSEAEQLMGRHTRDIEEVLGYRGREELIHRDDLVLTR